jgi:hypothetical protein
MAQAAGAAGVNQYKGPAYLAMQYTRAEWNTDTYRWGVFPMPSGGSVASFRGPFAGHRARRRARKLSRRAAR